MLKNYPGAKTNSGIIQFMVNEIPYHERYFELFAGYAQLFQKKKSAGYNYLYDINPAIVAALNKKYPFVTDSIKILHNEALMAFGHYLFTRNDFICLDPPYPAAARRSGVKLYHYEMLADDDHVKLLMAIRTMEANIMISTSPNELYELHLKDWRKLEFKTIGHRGPRVEVIYMNYPPPVILHQYDMLGADYIKRQAINRKVKRFVSKIDLLQIHLKHLLIQQLINNDPAAVQHFMAVCTGSNR